MRIEDQWIEFRGKVIPADAPPVQVIEMRRAFYAGVEALLRITQTAFDSSSEATDGDVQVLVDVESELKEFARLVQNGVR